MGAAFPVAMGGIPEAPAEPAPAGAATTRMAALRLLSALAFHRVPSDALLILADVAEEAAASALPWHRRDWRHLAIVLREIAPVMADVPLPADGAPAIPVAALRSAARALDQYETAGVSRLLRRMAVAIERWKGVRP